MPFLTRLRRPGARTAGVAALTVALALLLAACGQDKYPESVFHPRTDFNRDVGFLFKILIYAGTAVFVFVEGILVVALIRFRHRPGQPEPKHVHGNTKLEITWTVIPLLILMVIAIPTIRTIFKTQATARSDALQVEVIGHQWWWEFRYPQYTMAGTNGRIDTVVTANELYLPIGRTVNFTLRSKDVIHSFWVPALAGKRDVVSNHTNYLWYTPDSSGENVWNGACVEYCGTSHANMRFKAFTVSEAEFSSWIAHQETMAQGAGVPSAPASAATQVVQAGFIAFPREKLPAYSVPQTPLPAGLSYDDNALAAGNAVRGDSLVTHGMCIACHSIRGEPMMVGNIGPNLTHIGSRTTIGAGLYPNDPRHLARWVKNASAMKPGIAMPTFGLGEYDPVTIKGPVKIGFTDQQIADIVAYLQSLK